MRTSSRSVDGKLSEKRWISHAFQDKIHSSTGPDMFSNFHIPSSHVVTRCHESSLPRNTYRASGSKPCQRRILHMSYMTADLPQIRLRTSAFG
jgi:hypothetical protein